MILSRADARLIAANWHGAELVQCTNGSRLGVRGMRPDQSAWVPVTDDGERRSRNGLAHQPLDLPTLYQARFNRGDLDGLLELYEPEAELVASEAGNTVSGEQLKAELRLALAGNPVIKIRSRLLVKSGNLALVSSRWTITSADASKKSGVSADVCRSGVDGGWLYVMDDPFGVSLHNPDEDDD